MLDENSHRIANDKTGRTNDGDASRLPFQRDAASTFHLTSRKDAEWEDTTYRDSYADRLKTIRSGQTCQYRTREGDTQVEELWTPDGGRPIVSRGNIRGEDRPEQRDKDAVDAEVENQRVHRLSSGGEIEEDSLTPSRYRRFPSTGRGLATSNKESCRANELMLVERQRIQIDPRGVERQPAERKRVPAGDRCVERELLDVPRISRTGSHSIEHRIPNRQIMGERLEDDYIYIHPSDDDNPISNHNEGCWSLPFSVLHQD